MSAQEFKYFRAEFNFSLIFGVSVMHIVELL